MSDSSPESPRPRGSHRRKKRKPTRYLIIILLVVFLGGGGAWWFHAHQGRSSAMAVVPTTAPTSSTTTTSTTQPPGPGFVAGKITAIGDSVMIDYQDPLTTDLPGITVDATVSRQWYEGEQILTQLKAENQLGAKVIVALSTNGPITAADFDQMMSILTGASKVVFVNTHVDQPWQDPNNAVLATGVKQYPNAVLVDWNSLANQNPTWFGSDGTHLAIDGTGADSLASLIASSVT